MSSQCSFTRLDKSKWYHQIYTYMYEMIYLCFTLELYQLVKEVQDVATADAG